MDLIKLMFIFKKLFLVFKSPSTKIFNHCSVFTRVFVIIFDVIFNALNHIL